MEAWVTWPERPKGVKDEVKQARRAKSWPEGPPARSRAPGGPRLLVYYNVSVQNISENQQMKMCRK